ncbi:MAG: HD domain-containing protein [Lachnospiraceae bacterium]|nr:HD domain-containing protein [Lachnospiraceae bacterium]
MKTVAVMALQDGMQIAEDIVIGDKVAIKSGTKVDHIIKAKLEAFKLLTVNILDAEDLAETYYEKIRVSEAFSIFKKNYNANLAAYKVAVDSFIYKKVPFRFVDLKAIADALCPDSISGKRLFSYINIMIHDEADMSYAHGLNVALICKKMGKWLRMSPEDCETLIYAGFLFDIGKFMLPNDIIWKHEKLNKMEYDLVKTHAFYGYHMLSKYGINEHILNATLMHHERCDGSGYPQGLSRDEIDQFAMIIAIADVYEAMTSARSYRPPMNPYQVVEIIKDEMFLKYDVAIITTFLNHIMDEMIGNDVRLSNGMMGEVIMNNSGAIGRPVVRSKDGTVVDLSQQRDIKILELI